MRYGLLSFRDSCCLLSGGLPQLIEDNQEGSMAQIFPLMAERHPYRQVGLDMLLRKMPFPYNDLTDRPRLSPGYRIPRKAAFYNDLREEDVHEEEWSCWEAARDRPAYATGLGFTTSTWPPMCWPWLTSSRASATASRAFTA